MPLILRPMVESDVAEYDRVTNAAFHAALLPLLYPNGKSEADHAHSRAATLKALRTDPHVRYMVVVDTDLDPEADGITTTSQENHVPHVNGHIPHEQQGRVISAAMWKMQEHDRSEEEVAADDELGKDDADPPGVNVEMMEEWKGAIKAAKREVLGGWEALP